MSFTKVSYALLTLTTYIHIDVFKMYSRIHKRVNLRYISIISPPFFIMMSTSFVITKKIYTQNKKESTLVAFLSPMIYCLEMYPRILLLQEMSTYFSFLAYPSFRTRLKEGLYYKWNAKNSKSPQEF